MQEEVTDLEEVRRQLVGGEAGELELPVGSVEAKDQQQHQGEEEEQRAQEEGEDDPPGRRPWRHRVSEWISESVNHSAGH